MARVGKELIEGIQTLFPEKLGHSVTETLCEDFPSADPIPLRAACNGYLQAIDEDQLLCIAVSHDLVIRLHIRPGSFLVEGDVIADVYPNREAPECLTKEIGGTFIVGDSRSAEQDVEYSINQLVEICLRALSPGINDPQAAITSLDWLGAGPARLWSDRTGRLTEDSLRFPYRHNRSVENGPVRGDWVLGPNPVLDQGITIC